MRARTLTLRPPFFISSRLMAAVNVGDTGVLQLEPTLRADRHGKPYWRVVIDHETADNGTPLYESTDLCGYGDHVEMMETLCAFLTAAADAYRYALYRSRTMGLTIAEALADTDCGTLFPLAVTDWAYHNENELETLQGDLQAQIEGGAE